MDIATSTNRKIWLDEIDFNLFSEKFHNSSANKPCTVCGRETSNKNNSSGVIVTDGGASIVHPADAEAEYEFNMTGKHNGWMGWFPVGSECIKKIPAEFRSK